jgi:hypothetical protein
MTTPGCARFSKEGIQTKTTFKVDKAGDLDTKYKFIYITRLLPKFRKGLQESNLVEGEKHYCVQDNRSLRGRIPDEWKGIKPKEWLRNSKDIQTDVLAENQVDDHET